MTEIPESQHKESPSALAEVNTSSSPRPGGLTKWQQQVIAVASVGLALSAVLEFIHVKTHLVPDADSFCSVGRSFDCAAVAASSYAVFLGVPWAVWGGLGFTAAIVATYLRNQVLLILSGAAALTSIALLGISVLSLKSVCLLCEAVHVVSLLLFVLSYRNRHELTNRLNNWSDLSTILGAPAGLIVAFLLIIPQYWGSPSSRAEPQFPTGITDDGYHWVGSENPTVTIHEYVHYRCPFCKIGSSRLLRMLSKNDDWRIVRHEQTLMPCNPERERACETARMTYCAGEQGKFWRADRWLFEQVKSDKRFDRQEMIRDLELDPAKFETCYRSEAAYKYGSRSFEDARKKGIINIPAYDFEGPVPEELKALEKSHKRKTLEE